MRSQTSRAHGWIPDRLGELSGGRLHAGLAPPRADHHSLPVHLDPFPGPGQAAVALDEGAQQFGALCEGAAAWGAGLCGRLLGRSPAVVGGRTEAGEQCALVWAAEHGHFLPPATAAWQGYPIGVWAKNQRAAGRKALVNIVCREAGMPVDAAGAMPQTRLDALDDIDPGCCPAWDTNWQRSFQLTKAHVDAGEPLPAQAGAVIVQGEDLGRWVTAQRRGWHQLTVGQQVLLEILGLEPAGPRISPSLPPPETTNGPSTSPPPASTTHEKGI